jgi:glucose/arabinose dehydrogenase
MKTTLTLLKNFGVLASLVMVSSPAFANGFVQDITGLKVPPGFEVKIYANGLPDARSLAVSQDGTVFVSSRTEGRLYALPGHIILTDKLDTPNGIDVYNGDLYVAEKSRLLKISKIESVVKNFKPGQSLKFEVLRTDLPAEDDHGWRYLRAHEGWLYVSIGAPCNVCLRDQDQYAVIVRYSLDGKKREVVARGVRNSVGFDFAPANAGAGEPGSLWFTDNGRDLLGDDQPGDELNHVTRLGEHFGFPFCHQGSIPDPEFAAQAPLKNGEKNHAKVCAQFSAPVQVLGAHVASLGMRFYEGTQFPPEYRHRVFIAEHGSWNRSSKVGYRVSMVTLKDGHAVKYEPFMTGFLLGDSVSGRPVDVQPLKDGSLLVSDDKAGAIYQVTYSKK